MTTFKNEQKTLVLAGDGRSDSPGHCAKYDSYSVIELSCNKVFDFKLVQVCRVIIVKNLTTIYLNILFQSSEVGGSYHMENEGLHRLIEFLKGEGLQIGVIVTDPHKQINKWIRETHPEVACCYRLVSGCTILSHTVITTFVITTDLGKRNWRLWQSKKLWKMGTEHHKSLVLVCGLKTQW